MTFIQMFSLDFNSFLKHWPKKFLAFHYCYALSWFEITRPITPWIVPLRPITITIPQSQEYILYSSDPHGQCILSRDLLYNLSDRILAETT